MQVPIYQVDAFTSQRFGGNPAAVCPLTEWLPDAQMQAIAAENNLAETAFFIPMGNEYALRWFTPVLEMDLCGHATLATAHTLFTELVPGSTSATFHTRSGPLTVTRDPQGLLTMDFPASPPTQCEASADLLAGLGRVPRETWRSIYYMAVFDDEATIRGLQPTMEPLTRLDRIGVIATAPGDRVDFVSRFFAPQAGVPEDPVTGSAHCMLTPYWSQRLGKTNLHALQISPRVGELFCEDRGSRTIIAGHAVTYLTGTIHL
jgi:PhzF family phenazine biosynthesis protein